MAAAARRNWRNKESMRTPLSFTISRKARARSPTRHGGLRTQVGSPVSGNRPQGKLEGWILAQNDRGRPHPRSRRRWPRMRARKILPSEWVIQQGIARISDDGGEFVATPSRRSACPSNITPESDVMRPPSKAAVIFLRPTAGKRNGERISFNMAGVALDSDAREGSV